MIEIEWSFSFWDSAFSHFSPKDFISDPHRNQEGLRVLFEYFQHKADILESEDSMSMCLKLNGEKLHQDWEKLASISKGLKVALAEGAGLVDFPLPADFVPDAMAFAQR